MSVVESIWTGTGAAATVARAALWPLARLYELSVRARASLYEANVLSAETAALPTLSVGNLTVGGTGKTPVSAWIAHRLQRSARPAIVLRGYGADEIDVHRRLNPDIPVIANADRRAAAREAQERGVEVVVLDDAFQHLKLRATQSVLLLSAEQLERPLRMLPAGPWREQLSAARRADLIVVTRKSASAADAARVLANLRSRVRDVPAALVYLAPDALVGVDADVSLPVQQLRGAPVLAIAAIGEPRAFAAQLEELGARVTLRTFRDHHEFTADEIAGLAASVPRGGYAVCTLKDAVKLGSRWLGPSRLWYVSQRLVVEQGADEIDRVLTRVLEARALITSRAG